MILDQGPGGARSLTYCTNVHPGESIDEIVRDLQRHAVPLKARFRGADPFALGLRLGEAGIRELENDPRAFDRLSGFLDRAGFCVFTLNVFPQVAFHAPRLKEQVYQPDWTSPARASYTLAAARILQRLLPPAADFGTLSTVPVGFKEPGVEPGPVLEAAAQRLVRLAGDLARLEASTGTRILLCLEPEPCCLLENTADVVAFFDGHLLPAGEQLAAIDGKSGRDQVLRHLGACLDVCHLAVVFEDPAYGIERLIRSRIEVGKIQISSALEIKRPKDNRAGVRQLAAFDEARFLHQVVARDDRGELHRFPDLAPFLEWLEVTSHKIEAARCHFHVPIHLPQAFPLQTTQAELLDILERQRIRREVRHLEVETYSFDLIPAGSGLRSGLVDDLEQEIRFAHARLTA